MYWEVELVATQQRYLVSVRKGFFPALAASICGIACQDEKALLSDSETDSFSSGVSGWKLSTEGSGLVLKSIAFDVP
jgi:hypothetical protein